MQAHTFFTIDYLQQTAFLTETPPSFIGRACARLYVLTPSLLLLLRRSI
jgi:hypothetical protein